MLSCPRRRAAEVQRFQEPAEYLRRCLEPKAFPRGVVVGGHERIELRSREPGQVGLARQTAAQSPDGILDTAFLPRRMRIAEVRGHAELAVQLMMQRELSAVVEGQALSQQRQLGYIRQRELFACDATSHLLPINLQPDNHHLDRTGLPTLVMCPRN